MCKKIVFVILMFLILIPISVRADCDDCKPDDCASCGCVANKSKTKCIYSNAIVDSDSYKSCGKNLLGQPLITEIPSQIPKITHIAYNIIQILVPVLLVLFCSIDLVKAVVAGKEDDIKKNQTVLIKRLIAAVLVFFVFAVVKFVVSISSDNGLFNNNRIIKCADCFLSEVCE